MSCNSKIVNTMDYFSLRGRVAVVTGGGGFLGCEICIALCDAGASVVVADKNYDAARKVASLLNRRKHHSLAQLVDVTDAAGVKRFFKEVASGLGRIDILVNAAAHNPQPLPIPGKPEYAFEKFDLGVWQEDLAANLTGVMICCREVAPYMLKQRRGTIINLASMYGVVAPDQRLYGNTDKRKRFVKPVSYTVTKSGVIGLTKYLAAYWGDKGIRVNAISLGGVYNRQDAGFVRRYSERAPIRRMAAPHEIRGPVVFLASDASSYMTGANVVVDGGWTIW